MNGIIKAHLVFFLNVPKTMAVTHADLAPSRRGTDLGGKTGAFIIVLTIICGLFCFILCLIAESTRSQVKWVSNRSKGKGGGYECVYSGSGKTPLLSAAIAFVGLAVAMVVEHVYIMIVIGRSPPLIDPDSPPAKTLTWQAGFFFVTTWVCFAVGEILLLIGLGVESGHLTNWSRPKPSCLILREGMFCAAGVFALTTVFLATGLYLTALRAQRISQAQETVRQEVLEAATLYASPPRSPPHRFTTIARENPIGREILNHQPSLAFPLAFGKQSNLV